MATVRSFRALRPAPLNAAAVSAVPYDVVDATAWWVGLWMSLLLERTVAHPEYLALTAVAALFTISIANLMNRLRLIFLLLDGLGLVVFTVIGCNIAREMGHPASVAIIAGMITGCAGGVMRDVLCNDVPLLFRKELYASVSIATGGIYMAGLHYGFDTATVTLVSAMNASVSTSESTPAMVSCARFTPRATVVAQMLVGPRSR